MATLAPRSQGTRLFQYRAFSCDVITFEITERKTHHVGVHDRRLLLWQSSWRDILVMLMKCVELDKIPVLHKLKQLYRNIYLWGFSIDIAIDILYKLYTMMASLF